MSAFLLFKGLLPLGGDLADEVSDALQALTIEQKVQGKADYIRLAKNGGPIEAFLYTITAHNIRVQNVTFTDAGQSYLFYKRPQNVCCTATTATPSSRMRNGLGSSPSTCSTVI